MEELRRKDAEQRERLKSNLAVLAELQREVAHWRSRTALARREWTEREESLASERAGMRAEPLTYRHTPVTAILLTLCLLAVMDHASTARGASAGHCKIRAC